MISTLNFVQMYPLNYPHKMNGKLTYKVKIKDDYIRQDGTCALFLQLFLNKERIRVPLDLSVTKEQFDKKKQRVNPKFVLAKEYNLIIEKKLADINMIEVTKAHHYDGLFYFNLFLDQSLVV